MEKGPRKGREQNEDSRLKLAKRIFCTIWQGVLKGMECISLCSTAWGLAGHRLGGSRQLLVHHLSYTFIYICICV